MDLPSELLQAISVVGGGKITLVVGAGCSLEAPTAIPLSANCSHESHARLIADGILQEGECSNPWDLSCLADAVFNKSGKQQALVRLLNDNYSFKTATPNEGHKIAAALLREGAISSVVTLNFDLALSAAIADLGVGDRVGVIECPEDLPNQKASNLYYLHRNANAANPETWILRTEALRSAWQDHWEGVVAHKVLTTPVVIFVGLGSPADVLTESTKLIQKKVPDASKVYQVDPGEPCKSPFFQAMGLSESSFIKAKWCDFMAALSERLVIEQANHLKRTATALAEREQLFSEDLTELSKRLLQLGLVSVGKLRANWLLQEKPYLCDEPTTRELFAEILLSIAMIERETGSKACIFEDGVVEFYRGGRAVSSYIWVSGGGTRSQVAIETELSTRRRRFYHRAVQPTGAIVANTRGGGAPIVSPPVDLILGQSSDSIVTGSAALQVFHVDALRQDSLKCKQVAP